jgi:DnaK suppressor protein
MNAAVPYAQLDDAQGRAEVRVRELTRVLTEMIESSEAANLDDEHDPEGATVGFERAQTAALLDQARAELLALEDARERVRRGEYGACETCGTPIPAARLEARPATRLCMNCAAREPRSWR